MYMKKSKESTKMLPELIFLSISNKLLEIGFLKKKNTIFISIKNVNT